MLHAMDEARQIREFWFGKGRLGEAAADLRSGLWFGAQSQEQQQALDEEIRQRFGSLIERAARGELDSWADGTRRRLSLILLLDQFTRNVHRGTSRAFAQDAKALELTLSGMQSGADAALEPLERLFFFMPLQHAESLEVQDESVAAYRRLLSEAPPELKQTLETSLQFAEEHREIIRRYGRFPHRNRALGRISTPAEKAFLANSPRHFGQ
jgi:uncharacterized protein (DUF924 family)